MQEETKKTILLIDDDPMTLRTIRAVLREEFKVVMADSAMSGMTYLESHHPDLILLDYEMPTMNGPQFFKRVRAREHFKDIPVIFLTGKSDKDTVMEVIESKPDGYILKSTPPRQIMQKIKDFFHARNL